MQKIDSGRKTILDEIKTVDKTAEQGICSPVLTSEPEPLFDLALIIDENSSMVLWQHFVKDLQQLVEHYGIFREVSTWGLAIGEEKKVTLVNRKNKKAKSKNPEEIIDPSGRCLIIIVSDCVGERWFNGSLLKILKNWSKYQPLALLQILPHSLWLRSGLKLCAGVKFTNSIKGNCNQNLPIKELLIWKDFDLEQGSKIPVFTVEIESSETDEVNNWSVSNWSKFLMGKHDQTITGFIFPSESEFIPLPQLPQSKIAELNAEERIERFRRISSPLGRKLAGLLAASPVITLPIVRIIQEKFLDESSSVHIAEVFLGGIFKPLTEITPEINPDSVIFDVAVEGIRTKLLNDAPFRDSETIFWTISDYIERKLGKSLRECVASLVKESEDGTEDITLENVYAQISLQVLNNLGENYAQFAQEIQNVKIDYTQLENLLKSQQWQKADRETGNLILKVANQTKRGWVDAKDIENLPTDTLLIIDRLWKENSFGNFGFTVQKQIWSSCGCELDPEDNEAYQQFGKTVGWFDENNWLTWDELNFSLEASKGHLPRYLPSNEQRIRPYLFLRTDLFDLRVELSPNSTSVDIDDSPSFPFNVDWKQFDVNVAKIEIEPEASEPPQSEKETRKALVIGINNYQSDRIPNLNNATHDADAIAQMLEDYGDFQITKLPTNNDPIIGNDLLLGNNQLIGNRVDLSKDELENALIELFMPSGKDIPDVALFYFSGHGFIHDEVTSEGFLATSDALPERGFNGLSLQWLRRLLQESPIPTQIIWLDCCFSGELFNFQELNPRNQGRAKNRCFIASSKAYQLSDESKNSQHGAFTEILLKALNPKRLPQQWINNYGVTSYLEQEAKNLQQSPVIYNFGEPINLTRLTIKLKTFTSETVFVNKQGKIIKRQPLEALYFEQELGEAIEPLKMISIPPGEFWMGSPENEKDSNDFERPQHLVKVATFYLSQTPITQAQWRAVASLPQEKIELKPNPSRFEGDNLPVESVSWYDAMEFCARLSRHTQANYRLPSEAEWEYACRAINSEQLSAKSENLTLAQWNKNYCQPFHFGKTISTELANYDGKSTYGKGVKGEYRQKTTPVGNFYPNAFGLYNLHGNVWEWCADPWHNNYDGAPDHGKVWDEQADNDNRYHNILENLDILFKDKRSRVRRGGSWFLIADICRSAYRDNNFPAFDSDNNGFRVVRG